MKNRTVDDWINRTGNRIVYLSDTYLDLRKVEAVSRVNDTEDGKRTYRVYLGRADTSVRVDETELSRVNFIYMWNAALSE